MKDVFKDSFTIVGSLYCTNIITQVLNPIRTMETCTLVWAPRYPLRSQISTFIFLLEFLNINHDCYLLVCSPVFNKNNIFFKTFLLIIVDTPRWVWVFSPFLSLSYYLSPSLSRSYCFCIIYIRLTLYIYLSMSPWSTCLQLTFNHNTILKEQMF